MDIKAVQKALWCCTHPGNCSSCSYDGGCGGHGCLNDLLVDAFEALTPRILRLDEIHRGMAVWLEYKDEPNVILAIGGASAGGVKCFITEDDRSVALLDKDYNVRWRAWTQEPTEEQRKEVQCG